ncbi:MAG: hypothetical protein CMI17_03095 [Opitutaceae bacterium]|nr:hypothetical protein [Opitutaceae bacterium]|tara:strand:- start:36 stop:1655 length:1620 start_codon:yes stop_codon:yes gene_type:complete
MNPARLPLLWFLIPLIAGIVVGRIFPTNLSLLFYTISLAFCFGSYYLRKTTWPLFISISLFLAGSGYVADVTQNNTIHSDLPVREAKVTFKIDRLFQSAFNQLSGLGEIVFTDTHLPELEGAKVYFSLNIPDELKLKSDPRIGSQIQAIGIFAPLDSNVSQNGFQSYLKNSGISGIFNRGKLLSISKKPSSWRNWLNNLLTSANYALTHQIESDSPAARSYRAMLLGLKSELSEQQKTIFLQSGALHLFAISGLHIGVIATCGHALFLCFRIPRAWIPLPNLLLITVFVFMTGGAPSAFRALLMIACFYLCQLSNRQSASINALVLSATICLLLNPLQLFQAGFQMSYVTVASILLFGVPIGKRLCDRWKPFKEIPKDLWSLWQKATNAIGRFTISSFAISVAAFLSSSALSIIYFNTLSTIGVLLNLILLPLASLTIISGFLSLAFSIIGVGPIISLFNHAAILILSLIHGILQAFSQVSGAHLTFKNPPIHPLFVLLSVLLIGLFFGYSRLWKFKLRWLLLFPLAYTGACIFTASVA